MTLGPSRAENSPVGRPSRRRRRLVALLGATMALQVTGTAAQAATPTVTPGGQRDVVANLW